MLEQFYPNEWVDSTYMIPWEEWFCRGKRGVMFDVDNTLVPHDAPADKKAIDLFARLRKIGFRTCLLSNNREPRVKKFAQKVGGTPYIFKSHKPWPKNYRKAMELMGTDAETTLFVGDQLFTDVWGANLAGVYSILVKPINPKEEIQIVLKRIPEKLVLRRYQKKYPNARKKYEKVLGL